LVLATLAARGRETDLVDPHLVRLPAASARPCATTPSCARWSSREPSTLRSAAGRSARRRVPATCSRAPTHALELVARRDAVVVVAGTGSWARSIRTILGPDDDAGRLVLGETINPPGSWSPSCGAAAPRRTRSS